MAGKLKVYRTPIGFHDAYVAATSQKAALAAWGTKTDLFARGVAETVTDEALAAEPLAHPGEVIRRSRGSAEEQLAALPVNEPASNKAVGKPKPAAKKPSRTALDEAEAALEQAEADHATALAELDRQQRQVDAERRRLETVHAKQTDRLERTAHDEREAYAARLAEWGTADPA